MLCCTYVCKQLFPRGIQFNAIELDEIRLERLDDIEAGIQSNIKVLKVGPCSGLFCASYKVQ